jgi:hypothetical protein
MRVRLTKIDELQFLTCLQHQVWGSKTARFKDWKAGDYLVFRVDKGVAGYAEVVGKPYVSKERVWETGIYPHRIPLKFVHAILPENRPLVLGEVRDALTAAWGPGYGYGILAQLVLPEIAGETIIKTMQTRANDLAEIQANLDQYLDQARRQREVVTKRRHQGGEIQKPLVEAPVESDSKGSREEESTHSRIQYALVRLGKITDCAVWIASNDHNRQYQGKSLGDGCLKALPNLGLSKEAMGRIALIDVIWVRQNSPVCAFEVEATTSIYSGLLRMSDLLSVVPALNIKLFIVAPRDRQDKVMAELSRPTFRKIGLNEYCRFIPTAELESLLAKVEGLEGDLKYTVLDRIAVELEEEVESLLE